MSFAVVVNLAAQVRNVRLHNGGIAVEVVLPYVVENLCLRKHAVCVEHQVVQQVELGGGEVDFLVSQEHLMGVNVQAQVVHAQNRVVFFLGVA